MIKYKRLWLVFLLPIAFILNKFAQYNIKFAEFYSAKIYPLFAQSIGAISGLFPFSLGEIIIIAGSIFIVLSLIYSVSKSIIQKNPLHTKVWLINLVVCLCCGYFLFVLFCGMNYYRYPFSQHSEFEIEPSSKDELINLCSELIDRANMLKPNLKTDDNNITVLFDSNDYETAKRAQQSFSNISDKYAVLAGNYPKPKPVVLSKLMSELQISGIFFPFTFESNVNVDIPSFQIPATMCHELTHLRGFMREDEANFISYLACQNSGYKDFEYSGVMLALTYSMNALYSADYDAFAELYDKYSDSVKMDLKFSSAYWKQFESKISEFSGKVNDSYLKANNQNDGVQSYGRMVDLLLAEYRQKQ